MLCMIFPLWRAGDINIFVYGLCITIPSYAEMEHDLQQHILCCCSNIPIVFPESCLAGWGEKMVLDHTQSLWVSTNRVGVCELGFFGFVYRASQSEHRKNNSWRFYCSLSFPTDSHCNWLYHRSYIKITLNAS